MNLKLDGRFLKELKKRIERYEFEVGVLEDKPYREPEQAAFGQTPPLTNYAGGQIRKATRKPSGKTVGEVLIANMKRLNINLLLRPFQEESAEINKFTTAFLKMAVIKNIGIKRVENLLQAVVRNPILKEEYGRNKAATADAKGFSRHLFDTGQMFKAIRARAKRV